MPDQPVVCAFLSLQFLQADVLRHQVEDFTRRLRQLSSIDCAQAGLLQPCLHVPAHALTCQYLQPLRRQLPTWALILCKGLVGSQACQGLATCALD